MRARVCKSCTGNLSCLGLTASRYEKAFFYSCAARGENFLKPEPIGESDLLSSTDEFVDLELLYSSRACRGLSQMFVSLYSLYSCSQCLADGDADEEEEEIEGDDEEASNEDDDLLPDAPGSSEDQGQVGGSSREADRDAGGGLARPNTRSASAKHTRQRPDAMLSPQVDAVYSAALNRLLRSPEGYKPLGMSTPPHRIEHTPFSEQIRSWTIAATSQDLR